MYLVVHVDVEPIDLGDGKVHDIRTYVEAGRHDWIQDAMTQLESLRLENPDGEYEILESRTERDY